MIPHQFANLLLVLLSSWIVWAGLAKLRKPELLEQAVAEILPQGINRSAQGWGRILGGFEIALGFLIATGEIALLRSLLVLGLALAIGAAGVAGIRQGATLRCGCFGANSSRPLGKWSVGSGVGMATVAAFTFTHASGEQLLPSVSLVLIGIAVATTDPMSIWRPETGHLPREGFRR